MLKVIAGLLAIQNAGTLARLGAILLLVLLLAGAGGVSAIGEGRIPPILVLLGIFLLLRAPRFRQERPSLRDEV
jgi:hypothetical protein